MRDWYGSKLLGLFVLMALALSLGCATRVLTGVRLTEPGGDEAKAESVKGIEIEVAWGRAKSGTGLEGAEISVPFANLLGPLLGQALQALPGVGSPPQPPPTIVVNGAESVTLEEPDDPGQ